ncbi:MAG TPA: DUF1003 domain-containing protein [Cyclobacteriaceae bacterium]|nr:DUF1003 domain-containing protein [Cyclobacteriaceae bacterium]
MKMFVSDVSKKEFPMNEKISGKSLRPSIIEAIQKEHPDFSRSQCLSLTELNVYREKYIANYLVKEIGELTELENTVLNALKKRDTISDKIRESSEENLTFGQRLADRVATFGGSWRFIIFFGLFLVIWISVNVFWLKETPFDPYPFILLNLILSCIAALQAPVIMMSQNRQEEKDRERSKKDYMINLKSELEIRMLHEKIDHLIIHQQHELIEIQKVQIDMMNDILNKIK